MVDVTPWPELRPVRALAVSMFSNDGKTTLGEFEAAFEAAVCEVVEQKGVAPSAAPRGPTFAQMETSIEKLEEIKQALELGSRASMSTGVLAMGSHTRVGASRETILLSGMLRRQQESYVARYIGDIVAFIFFGMQVTFSAYWWSKADMKFGYRFSDDPSGLGPDDLDMVINFKYLGMSQTDSGYHRGDEKVLSNQPYPQPGKAWLIDLTGEPASAEALAFEREESVTLDDSSTTVMSHSTEIDVGAKVDTKATIGGDAEGGKLEVEVEATFGYKDADEESKEDAHDESETEAVKIAEACRSSRATLVTVDSEDIRSITPRGFHGVPVYSVEFSVYKIDRYARAAKLAGRSSYEAAWWNQRHDSGAFYPAAKLMLRGSHFKDDGDWCHWSFEWDELLAWGDGNDPEMPDFFNKPVEQWPGLGMRHEAGDAYSKTIPAAFGYLNDAKKQRIDFDGVEHRSYKQGAHIRVADVTGQDLDKVMHDNGAENIDPSTLDPVSVAQARGATINGLHRLAAA